MIIDIYFILIMFSELERIFFSVKYTVSNQKNSFETEIIKLLKCMKSWFRLGIFTEQDLHFIVNIMKDGAVEAMIFGMN